MVYKTVFLKMAHLFLILGLGVSDLLVASVVLLVSEGKDMSL